MYDQHSQEHTCGNTSASSMCTPVQLHLPVNTWGDGGTVWLYPMHCIVVHGTVLYCINCRYMQEREELPEHIAKELATSRAVVSGCARVKTQHVLVTAGQVSCCCFTSLLSRD
jgi:hypothetical protein